MLALGGCAERKDSGVTAIELRCEYGINPLGVDTKEPRFSWLLGSSQRGQHQSAYQVLVAGSEEKLAAGTGDKWDSGKVTSAQSVNVVYKGSPLSSSEKCYWKVRCWDKDGREGKYSKPAVFEMGLLEQSSWQGMWIGAEKDVSAPLWRKQFEIARPLRRARAYICGLGWSELYINGRKVGDNVLDPATTNYSKRCLYVTHDVTRRLKEGQNAIGVWLGNGWYSEPGWVVYGDSPRVLIQMNIEFTDGSSESITTDGTWKTSSGPVIRNDIWGGETYDARLEKPGWAEAGYDDSTWGYALIKKSPGGRMVSQLMPAIKVNRTIKPVRLTKPKAGVYVYDMGQLFGGWARLRVKGPAGTKVAIKYSARILEDSGLIDKRRHREGNETDFYILKGGARPEVYEPRFTYHPVRYVQIEGYPGQPGLEALEGRVLFSAVDMTGDFHCSNPLLNQVHQNVVWTLTNGLFGIPLDCLHREHWAWTDPATITGSLYPRKYMPLFWTKWLRDIRDAQFEDGAVPVTAPNYRPAGHPKSYRIDPAWGGNYPILVWYLHQYYEDSRILKEHYEPMKRWIDYLTSTAEDHIIVKGVYGDHMLPGPEPGKEQFISKETPRPLVWTGYYYRGASVLSQVAGLLGKADDAERYAKLAENIRDAFNKKWLNAGTSSYATGSQTANLFPLALGIIPRANEAGVLKNIIRDIVEKYAGHLHTGNTGTTCIIDTLTRHGCGDVMYEVANKTTYPGWGYMVKQGATTIWESWGLGKNAESMIMWATIDEFFYEDLVGIRGPDYYGPQFMTPGFREIHIKPSVLGGLEYAGASMKTVRGIVSSRWKKNDNQLRLEVSIPVNSRGKVSLPKMGTKNVTVREGGKLVWKTGKFVKAVPGITGGSETGEYVTFDVGSGSYSFQLIGE
jgi:alpha-L-rhamnosidase